MPMLVVLFIWFGINFYLLVIVPKGFFPQQDTGRLAGAIQGAQDSSFTAMKQRMTRFVDIIKADPAIAAVIAFTGSGNTATNTGRMFISLKPLEERKVSADQVIGRFGIRWRQSKERRFFFNLRMICWFGAGRGMHSTITLFNATY